MFNSFLGPCMLMCAVNMIPVMIRYCWWSFFFLWETTIAAHVRCVRQKRHDWVNGKHRSKLKLKHTEFTCWTNNWSCNLPCELSVAECSFSFMMSAQRSTPTTRSSAPPTAPPTPPPVMANTELSGRCGECGSVIERSNFCLFVRIIIIHSDITGWYSPGDIH